MGDCAEKAETNPSCLALARSRARQKDVITILMCHGVYLYTLYYEICIKSHNRGRGRVVICLQSGNHIYKLLMTVTESTYYRSMRRPTLRIAPGDWCAASFR
jgi:hypothetical protein